MSRIRHATEAFVNNLIAGLQSLITSNTNQIGVLSGQLNGMKLYKSLDDLGLTSSATYADVAKAMQANSILISQEFGESKPSNYGTVTVTKSINDNRVAFEWVVSKGSPSETEIYSAHYHTTGGFSGWFKSSDIPKIKYINSGTHTLSNYIEEGTYCFGSGATITDIPTGVNGWITVLPANHPTASVIKQIWYRWGTANSNSWMTFERLINGTTVGDWTEYATTRKIDILKPVLLANGVFRQGDTITLSQSVSNFSKLLVLSGDGGGAPNPLNTNVFVSLNYPSALLSSQDVIYADSHSTGTIKFTTKSGGIQVVLNELTGGYVRKIYGYVEGV